MQWQRLGPGGGGALYIPTVHPTDINTAVVTCDMTGVYLTRNGGGSWQQLNFTGMTRAFAFNPFDSKVLYAGSSGLYCSQNDGATWEVMYPPKADILRSETTGDHASHAFVTKSGQSIGYVEGLLLHPKSEGTLWAGLNASRLTHFYERGLLSLVASVDGGQTWTKPIGLAGKKFVRICPGQGNSAILFTDEQILKAEITANHIAVTILQETDTAFSDAAYGINPETGNWIYYHTQVPTVEDSNAHRPRLYRSNAPEKGFEEIGKGLFVDHAEGQRLVFAHVAVSMGDARKVYLSLSEPMSREERVPGKESFFGMFISEDFGEHFRWALRIGEQEPENRTLGWVERDYSTGWGGAPFGIGICPTNPQVCYATDWGTCYRTVNGGKTWEQLYTTVAQDGRIQTTGLDITLVYNLLFDPQDTTHLAITCTDIGFFHSRDDGQTWQHRMNGIPEEWSNSCYGMVFDPEVRERAWSVWSDCHDLPRPKMYLNGHFARRRGGVCRTEDTFETWTVSNTGLPENTAPTCILLDPRSPAGKRTLYVTAMGNGVYRSKDDGASWQDCSKGIEGNMNAWKIFQSPDGVLYLLVARGLENGTETDGALYKSDNGAESWEAIPMPAGANAPNFLAVNPANSQCLYLACWPRMTGENEGFGGLYQTCDGGQSWQLLTADNSHVYGVAVDPRNPAHVVWSNFENQVWESFDGAKTAAPIKGFTFKWAHQPIFHPSDPNRLYVATFGSGLWMGKSE